MFNFNKQKFDFNYTINENKHTLSLSLDDFDDEIDVQQEIQSKSERVENFTNFKLFLAAKIFSPLELDNPHYAWKEVSYNNEKHYIAYIDEIFVRKSQNENKEYHYQIYVDLNDTTHELRIGNCTSFKKSRFMGINYPLIKICEKYQDGPVYIGDIYVDLSFGTRETCEKILNKINLPLIFPNITNNISIYRCVWKDKKYYLPDQQPGDKFIDIDNKLVFSHDFVNHLAGFSNNLDGVNVNLFYKLFKSFDDFAKVTKLLCEKGATVCTEFGTQFNENVYERFIEQFKIKVDEELGIESEEKRKFEELEIKSKQYLLDVLSPNVIDHFDSIISKSPNLLSIKTMFKERKSKDPFRKFDLPVIELILKDNGIDIDNIVNSYETKWTHYFYKFANLFIEHCKRIQCCNRANYVLDNIERGNVNFKYIVDSDTNGQSVEYRQFDGLSDEELKSLKEIIFGLKPNISWDAYSVEVNESLLKYKDKEDIEICRKLLSRLGRYSESFVDDDNVDNHVYNKFLLLQRFVYLLYVLNDEKEGKNLKATALYSMKFHYIEYGYYGGYIPFNLSDISMTLNCYQQLYKFIKQIAYIIENGFNIKFPNLGAFGYDSSFNHGIFKVYGIEEKDNMIELINNEFDTNNNPNMRTLNTTSINKMMSTIFTNIDKKI